eukprot:SAG11_NODE_681_length_7772_cov_26.403362_9_plen_38_part_00
MIACTPAYAMPAQKIADFIRSVLAVHQSAPDVGLKQS